MSVDLASIRARLLNTANSTSPISVCTLFPEECAALLNADHMHYECEACHALVRSPGQLDRDYGGKQGWHVNDLKVLADHNLSCVYAAKLRLGKQGEEPLGCAYCENEIVEGAPVVNHGTAFNWSVAGVPNGYVTACTHHAPKAAIDALNER